MATEKKKRQAEKRSPGIEVPLGQTGDGYLPRMVQVGNLTLQQRTNLKRMLVGLQSANAMVTTPRLTRKHVDSYGDVVRYLLENIK